MSEIYKKGNNIVSHHTLSACFSFFFFFFFFLGGGEREREREREREVVGGWDANILG